jgi:hypothetical protein
MSLITIGWQSHPVVHLKCWVPPVLFAGEKSPKCRRKNKWKKIPFSLKIPIYFFIFRGECRRSLFPGYRFNGPLQKCRR